MANPPEQRTGESQVAPESSERERAALREFCRVLDRVREEVDEAVRAAAASVPAFAQLIEQLDPELAERDAAASRELERGALMKGDWAPYLANLRSQGATYAAMGVAFEDWFALLRPYREVISRAAFERGSDAEPRLVLEGLGRFLDIAMSTLAGAYLATKEALVRQKEVELSRHVRELERSNQELDEFAYVASHDLKAPLRDVQTLAGWVLEDCGEELGEGSRRHLTTLTERMSRMERLLEDLLTYSRVGRQTHPSEELDVAEVIAEAGELALPSTGFTLRTEGGRATLFGPRVPLETVLRNLLGNAVKHHDEQRGEIVVRVEPRDDDVAFSVVDDGPGIPTELQEKAFRMFQTLRPRDEVEGSGMGLAIVRKMVESRGGSVTLESVVGEGTTVHFTWPREIAK